MQINFTKEFLKDWEELFSGKWYYRLVRFIKFVKRIPKEIKWAFQRVFRGYDDTIYWNLYDYLGRNIIKHLKNFRDSDRHGTPSNACIDDNGKELSTEEGEKKWLEIINKMIAGFEGMITDPIDKEPWKLFQEKKISREEWIKKEREEAENNKKNAMLFIEYFQNLWD